MGRLLKTKKWYDDGCPGCLILAVDKVGIVLEKPTNRFTLSLK